MALEDAMNGLINLSSGVIVGLCGNLHRGIPKINKDTGVNETHKKGLSNVLIKIAPGYRHVSPIVDHIAWNVGATLGVGGFLEAASYGHISSEYVLAAGVVTALNLLDTFSTIERRRDMDRGDAIQFGVDMTLPAITGIYGPYVVNAIVS